HKFVVIHLQTHFAVSKESLLREFKGVHYAPRSINARHHPRLDATCMRGFVTGRPVHAVGP
ncbi:MAG TPA: hypothetical protein VNA17_01220, partial [Pyrinomonadaceae bacterium]|nr:hypothetical protein [Pyrinomonadaceae bacterium]